MKQLSKLVNKSSTLKVLSCKHEPMKGFLSVNKDPGNIEIMNQSLFI